MKHQRPATVLILAILLALTANTFAQNEKPVREYGTLPYTGMAKILVKIDGPITYDSVYFNNGVAIYKQDKYDGEIGWLYAIDVDRNMVHYIILEKGTITITATRDSMIFITGTPNNDAFFTLDQTIEPLRLKMKALGREVDALRKRGEDAKADKVQEEILGISKVWWGRQTDFAKAGNSLSGLNYVTKLAGRFSTSELKVMLEQYKSLAAKSAYKSLARRVEAEMKTDVGVMAPAFNLISDHGGMLALDSLKKKLTIIDFWASWCKPCRAENPNLISLYDKWKGKGLEIVSVSIDKPVDKERWLDAIREDKLTWLQVWDEKGATNKEYGVTTIPRTFLVDASGKIVAKDLRGEELSRFVANWFSGEK